MKKHEIQKALENYLREEGVEFIGEYNGETRETRLQIIYDIPGKIRRAELWIEFEDDGYLVTADPELTCAEGKRAAMARRLMKLNGERKFGGFTLDSRSGAVLFRFAVDCRGLEEIPRDLIEWSLQQPRRELKNEGADLVRIARG